jgi:hypothetical protein
VQIVQVGDYLGIEVTLEESTWDFVYVTDDGYYYINPAGKYVKFEQIKTSTLFLADAFSGRGHIWDNTLPLLAKHIFIGSGANTYMFEYPQNDYILGGQSTLYNVKAHCMYLQQGVETGLLGLVCLLIFFGWYLVRSARIYRKADLKESITWVGIGLFAAVTVYLFAAIANDSNVCTAPVFWGMLGLGMAVNRMVAAKEEVAVAVVAEETEPTPEPIEQKSSAQTSIEQPKQTSAKKQSRKQRKNQKR